MMQTRRAPGTSAESANSIEELRQRFRSAMRRLASGVGVVATANGQRWFGMTATAITSLSMDPPSLVICVNRTASIHDPLTEKGFFSLNLLRREQAEIGHAFATLPSAERFTVGEWFLSEIGCPCLVGAQAVILCRQGPAMAFGTHTMIVGEVVDTIVDQAIDPLVFVNGTFLVE
ncbi:flavin reductase family protein [Rhodoligotrophos defluvii]|uniref:flavin reductase family protein n=1 Tax=Rhodoligotrophos defluvii TaxID=2561934 RepID=UPI0010C945C3|nr:flavin reductase family protein [Rhodoligotrophos defluvii]